MLTELTRICRLQGGQSSWVSYLSQCPDSTMGAIPKGMGFRIHKVDEGGDIISGVRMRMLCTLAVALNRLANVPHDGAECRAAEK